MVKLKKDNSAIGQAIKEFRKLKGISQEDMASSACIDRTYASGLERGLKNPSLRVIIRIATALDFEPWELVKRAVEILKEN